MGCGGRRAGDGGVIRITPQQHAGGYTCSEHTAENLSTPHRQETDVTSPIDGIRNLTTDEINLVSGGQTWAYEIRSPDGVLDVGMRLDKATGREIPYAIWTAAQ